MPILVHQEAGLPPKIQLVAMVSKDQLLDALSVLTLENDQFNIRHWAGYEIEKLRRIVEFMERELQEASQRQEL